MNKMVQRAGPAAIAFVGRRGSRQGVSGYVAPVAGLTPYEAGLVTVALGGSYLLSAFVQQRPFYTAQNVAVLTPRDATMPLKYRLYYAACIRHNAFRYTAFGREANRTLGSIDLPSHVPAWVDAAAMPTVTGVGAPAGLRVALGDPAAWRDFAIGDLFWVRKGQRLIRSARSTGSTRFIGASEKNNGVTDLADAPAIFSGGCLTVPYNGNSVGWAFYQDAPFFASDDVNVLEPRVPMSRWTLLFIAAVIRKAKGRYTYGYKWNQERMIRSTVRLPATPPGDPNFAAMDRVMRGLPFSKAIEDSVSDPVT